MCGFSVELWNRVSQQLQLKHPDHFPEDPYRLAEIMEATNFVLGHTAVSASVPLTGLSPAAPVSPSPTQPTIKTEDIMSIFEKFTQTIASTMAAAATNRAPAQPQYQNQNQSSQPTNHACNFCGKETHYIALRPWVERYMTQGKIRKNYEGKVILPGGTFVPGSTIGRWLKDRVDEWHRLNPGQLAGGHMSSNANPSPTPFFGIARPTNYEPVTSALATIVEHVPTPAPALIIAPPQPVLQNSIPTSSTVIPVTTVVQDFNDHTTALQAEIYMLDQKK